MALAGWLALAYLVRGNPWNYTVGTAIGRIEFSAEALWFGPLVYAILSLPLVALLIPPVRRACLGRG
jgi:hypothetical protein